MLICDYVFAKVRKIFGAIYYIGMEHSGAPIPSCLGAEVPALARTSTWTLHTPAQGHTGAGARGYFGAAQKDLHITQDPYSIFSTYNFFVYYIFTVLIFQLPIIFFTENITLYIT